MILILPYKVYKLNRFECVLYIDLLLDYKKSTSNTYTQAKFIDQHTFCRNFRKWQLIISQKFWIKWWRWIGKNYQSHARKCVHPRSKYQKSATLFKKYCTKKYFSLFTLIQIFIQKSYVHRRKSYKCMVDIWIVTYNKFMQHKKKQA